MASPHPLAVQRLARIARPLQITQPEHAAGRCLSASLDFALAARQQTGETLRLVKWRVHGDRHHVDHWAVLADDTRVIDLTRVQVDGKRQLVCALDDYPAHYVERRIYPAELLTTVYAESGSQEGLRLSNGFLWRCGLRLMRFDLSRAWRERAPSVAAAALRESVRFVGLFAMGCVSRSLERRARRLVSRLHEQPDLSARRSLRFTARIPLVAGESELAAKLSPSRVWLVANSLAPAANAHFYGVCTLVLACA